MQIFLPENLVLALTLVVAAQAPPAVRNDPPINDNSFLIEEAYNQDRGSVQHTNVVTHDGTTGEWTWTFSQEWPVNSAPRHQLSYSVGAESTASAGAGLSDAWLNYRYQLLDGSRLAVAPRVSVSLPLGSASAGRGAGGTALELALPLSIAASRQFILHSNLIATVVPHALDERQNRAATVSVRVGESVVWQLSPRVNLLTEAILSRDEVVTGVAETLWATTMTINPGVRWAHNFANGLQIVPGLSFPVTFGDADRRHLSVLGYLSLEHPFGARR